MTAALIEKAQQLIEQIPVYTITYRAPWIDNVPATDARWIAEQQPFIDLQNLMRDAAQNGQFAHIHAAIVGQLTDKRIQVLEDAGYEGTLVSHWEARRGETADKVDLRPVVRNVDAWRKTFDQLNTGDQIAENNIIAALIRGYAQGLEEQKSALHILNIGARPGTATTAIKTLREIFGANASIKYSGTNHIVGQLEKTAKAVKDAGIPDDQVDLRKGLLGIEIDPAAFGKADIIVVPHVYQPKVFNKGLAGKLQAVSNPDTIAIMIYNNGDDIANLKDGEKFGSFFRPDGNMAEGVISALKSDMPEGTVISSTYTYHMSMPKLTEDDWHFITEDMPTAVYNRDWAAERGEDFSKAMDLIAFKIHVPINALPVDERREFVADLRKSLEANNDSIGYTVKYMIGHTSLLTPQSSPKMRQSMRDCARGEKQSRFGNTVFLDFFVGNAGPL